MRAKFPISSVLHTVFFALVALIAMSTVRAAEASDLGSEPDALIGTSERISQHEEASENIRDHEEASENIERHEGATENISNHEEGAENLRNHEAGSEQMTGRIASPERVVGFGHDVLSTTDSLATARAQLAAARARHAAQETHARANGASSGMLSFDQWKSRLDIAKHRVDVAKWNSDLMDKRYADMLESNYPTGTARQQLIDERAASKQRLDAEHATLPKLVAQARAAGVPQSIVLPYTNPS